MYVEFCECIDGVECGATATAVAAADGGGPTGVVEATGGELNSEPGEEAIVDSCMFNAANGAVKEDGWAERNALAGANDEAGGNAPRGIL